LNDSYIRFRCSYSQKLKIQARAEEKKMTVTDYILMACQLELQNDDQLVMIPVPRRYIEDYIS